MDSIPWPLADVPAHLGAHHINRNTYTWWRDAPRAEELFDHLWLPEEVKRKVKASTLRYIFCSETPQEFLQGQRWGPKQREFNLQWSTGSGTGCDAQSKAFACFLNIFLKHLYISLASLCFRFCLSRVRHIYVRRAQCPPALGGLGHRLCMCENRIKMVNNFVL